MSEALTDFKYGAQTIEMEAFIDRLSTITPEQLDALSKAYNTATAARPEELWDAWCSAELVGRDEMREEAWSVARDAVRTGKRNAAWYSGWYAILAILVRDLITPDQFDLLYSPWTSVMGKK
jgi:hypothetical protein